MSKGLKKAWPYIVVLLLLAAVAVFTGDELPFDIFGNEKESKDSIELPVDSAVVDEVIPADTVMVDTVSMEVEPKLVDESTVKEWRLVVASLPNKEHAERIATSLGGEANTIYVEYLDTYRVVYNSYSSLPEAQNGFDEISQQYPKAWLVYF
ncbi:sporulation related protein [Owenweeksia hongkongensis DSM 17368]|uniref:Sporulation related protein n=1 Tax=Owenweeksia hongkongensis (strain DSM 17368 / CIP 108786 / JCM 12287 / NRRL B-23963 / UST20020801) TaxID=926562 RepID=G8R2C9_OWEHD|nr:SPOR domain-containing protein [Owenweeksia hongkongensis]AEV32919.1 sporulation related protein [Owenweeksia hongkongensis DSM 17368]